MIRILVTTILAVSVLAGCAPAPLQTPAAGASKLSPDVPTTLGIFGLTIRFDDKGRVATIEGAVTDSDWRDFPLNINTTVDSAQVGPSGLIFIYGRSSPGCVYIFDPVTRKWRRVC
jgi:hypothetical protein